MVRVTGRWGKLHYVELCDLYSSPSICVMSKAEKDEMDGACSTNWGEAEHV
jgi:hypothetical protein